MRTSYPPSRAVLHNRYLEDFTETLNNLLRSGLSLPRLLQIYSDITHHQILIALSRSLLQSLEKGMNLSDAMSSCSPSFPRWYIAFITVGEETGDLVTVSRKILEYLKQQRSVREKVISAMIYPLFILSMISVGLMLFSTLFMPRMIQLLSSFNNTAAFQLQQSLNVLFIGSIAFLLFVITLIIIHTAYRRSRSGSRLPVLLLFWESIVLRTPLLGTMIIEQNLLRLFFSLHLFLQNGIPIDRALEKSLSLIDPLSMRKATASAIRGIQNGVPPSSVFEQNRQFFSPEVKRWMKIGEETGESETAVMQLHEYLKLRTNSRITRLLNLLEPALTMLVGAIILMLVIQYIVPFFTLFTEVL